MNTHDRIQACIQELGVVGTPEEAEIRSLLEQLLEKQPPVDYDETYLQELLLQLKQHHRRKQTSVTGRVQRYKRSLIGVPVGVMVIVSVLGFRLSLQQNTFEQPVEEMQADDTAADMMAESMPMQMKMEARVMQAPAFDESMISQEQALAILQDTYTDLQDYPADTLPPRDILAQQYPDGRNIAFVTLGSGLPGILEARCYQVTNSSQIIELGTFDAEDGDTRDPDTFDIGTCE